MENEPELNRIFEETLFLKKRQDPATLIRHSVHPVTADPVLNKDELSDTPLYTDYTEDKEQDKKEDETNTKRIRGLKERDVNIQREKKEPNSLHGCDVVHENSKRVTIIDAPEVIEVEGRKEHLKRVEAEFNRLRKLHLESLKFKSKIYQFVYAELSRMEVEKDARIRELEEENRALRQRVESVEGMYQRFKEYVGESIGKWKTKVLEAVKRYRKEIESTALAKVAPG